MNETNRALADALYSDAVADQEKIRAAVLARAHGAQPDTGTPRRAQISPFRRFMKIAAAPLAACLAFFILLNVSAPFAAAVERVPVLGGVARLITLRSWHSEDEASSIQGQQPGVEGTGSEAFESETNALIEAQLSRLDAAARADAEEYRKNWIAMGNDASKFIPIAYQFDYETYCASDAVLSFLIRQQETITTDTADTYTTLFYYTLDVKTGKALTLNDLLGENWKTLVADEVDRQLRAGGDSRKLAYYQEFWVDKNLLPDDAQKFYLTADGAVAVVFDEGWIAPFEDGPQTFILTATPRLG